MEIKNINLFFPWGAGGNFVKNIFVLDPKYILLGEDGLEVPQDKKFQYLLDYYNTDVDSHTWIDVEAKLRSPTDNLLLRAVESNNSYIFTPRCTTHKGIVSLLHRPYNDGAMHDLDDNITSNMFHDQINVFLDFENTHDLAKIYHSKNVNFNKSADQRTEVLLLTNRLSMMSLRLHQFKDRMIENGKTVYTMEASNMFTSSGFQCIIELVEELGLTVPDEQICRLHKLWFNATELCYKSQFNMDL